MDKREGIFVKKGLIVANQGIVLSSIVQQVFSDKEAQTAKKTLEERHGDSVQWAITDYQRLQSQLKEETVSYVFLCSTTKQFKQLILDAIQGDTQLIDTL